MNNDYIEAVLKQLVKECTNLDNRIKALEQEAKTDFVLTKLLWKYIKRIKAFIIIASCFVVAFFIAFLIVSRFNF